MAWEWVAPVVTGTVGTITISTTVWLAQKQVRLQESRIHRGDQRTVYGQFLAATHEMIDCAIRLVADAESSTEEADISAFRKARIQATARLGEISITGPTAVERLAEDYLSCIRQDEIVGKLSDIAHLRVSLIAEMRKELGNLNS